MQAALLLDVADSEGGLSTTEKNVEVHEVRPDGTQRQESSPHEADDGRP